LPNLTFPDIDPLHHFFPFRPDSQPHITLAHYHV
jgi:hypothetical protein